MREEPTSSRSELFPVEGRVSMTGVVVAKLLDVVRSCFGGVV